MRLHENTCERSAHHGCAYHGFRLGCRRWYVSPSRSSTTSNTLSCAIAILHALFPGLDEVSALCIAACLTPTDPVTCAAITRPSLLLPLPQLGIHPIFCLGGRFATKHVPEEIRHILTAEAAANDGLAYPFLSIAIYLTVETSTRVAIGEWFLVGWLCKLVHVGCSPSPF
jgi:NhaP-type Na+/H+ or K+/H+ antiporter